MDSCSCRPGHSTGKYPARLLLTDWLPSGRWNPKARLREGRFLRGLPLEEFTLADLLAEDWSERVAREIAEL